MERGLDSPEEVSVHVQRIENERKLSNPSRRLVGSKLKMDNTIIVQTMNIMNRDAKVS